MDSIFWEWVNSKTLIIIKKSEFVPTEINEYIAKPVNCKSNEASVSVEILKKITPKETCSGFTQNVSLKIKCFWFPLSFDKTKTIFQGEINQITNFYMFRFSTDLTF